MSLPLMMCRPAYLHGYRYDNVIRVAVSGFQYLWRVNELLDPSGGPAGLGRPAVQCAR